MVTTEALSLYGACNIVACNYLGTRQAEQDKWAAHVAHSCKDLSAPLVSWVCPPHTVIKGNSIILL